MIKVLIYCANGYAQKVMYSLDESQYQIIGIIDSNKESWNTSVDGVMVFPPTMIPNLEYDFVIISVSQYANEITSYLVQIINVDPNKIVVFTPNHKNIYWLDDRLVALRKCMSFIKDRDIEGDMAELGVYKGDFCKFFNLYFPQRKLYLFDTFNGFDAKKDSVKPEDLKSFKDTSVDIVLNKMKNPENCIVYKGYFPDSVRDSVVDTKFALVSLDCDLYEPIYAGLEFFYPRLSKGGYIFVHDFGSYHYTGVKKAVFEYCKKTGAVLFPLTDRGLSVVITK